MAVAPDGTESLLLKRSLTVIQYDHVDVGMLSMVSLVSGTTQQSGAKMAGAPDGRESLQYDCSANHQQWR